MSTPIDDNPFFKSFFTICIQNFYTAQSAFLSSALPSNAFAAITSSALSIASSIIPGNVLETIPPSIVSNRASITANIAYAQVFLTPFYYTAPTTIPLVTVSSANKSVTETTTTSSTTRLTPLNTATTSSSSSAVAHGLSPVAKVGIGLGIGLGLPLLAMIIGAAILLFRRKRRNRPSAESFVTTAPGGYGTAKGEKPIGHGVGTALHQEANDVPVR